MKERIIIFGAGKIAEVISHLINKHDLFEIGAYCCDKNFIQSETFLGKPLLTKEKCKVKYKPKDYKMFVALGYYNLNKLREEKCAWAKENGYSLIKIFNKNLFQNISIGDNSILMEKSIVQPGVKIGKNVFVWDGAIIGHHTKIKDNCWITSGSTIGGNSIIGNSSLLGLNSTIGNDVALGKQTIVGANCTVTKSCKEYSVFIQKDTEKYNLDSMQFLNLTNWIES